MVGDMLQLYVIFETAWQKTIWDKQKATTGSRIRTGAMAHIPIKIVKAAKYNLTKCSQDHHRACVTRPGQFCKATYFTCKNFQVEVSESGSVTALLSSSAMVNSYNPDVTTSGEIMDCSIPTATRALNEYIT